MELSVDLHYPLPKGGGVQVRFSIPLETSRIVVLFGGAWLQGRVRLPLIEPDSDL